MFDYNKFFKKSNTFFLTLIIASFYSLNNHLVMFYLTVVQVFKYICVIFTGTIHKQIINSTLDRQVSFFLFSMWDTLCKGGIVGKEYLGMLNYQESA